MEVDFSLLPTLIGLAAMLFVAYMLLYFKFIYSIIDPLFIWVFTTAFASVLAIQIIPDTKDLIHFFGCQISLWIGFVLAYRQFNLKKILATNVDATNDLSEQLTLRWTIYILLAVYVLSNIIIGYSKGFALLSSTPTESKIANFQNGFGLFRKINWSTGTFVSTGLIFMYLLKRRKIDLYFLIIVILFSSLEGSKSALLQIAVSAGIVFYHPFFLNKKNLLDKFKKYVPVILSTALGVFFVVLIKETDDYNSAFFAFIRRLLYSGDSLLYYYQPVNVEYFQRYSALDYISVVTNPILGFFRLQPYREAPGNIMVDNLRLPGSFDYITVGPNAPFYIEGRIYFYYWGAFFFCIIVGYIYARIRALFFSLKNVSAFQFVYMASFFHLASTIINDVSLAVTQLFDLTFFVVPPYILTSLMLNHKISIKLNKQVESTKQVLNDSN